jgi:hypothetical protein
VAFALRPELGHHRTRPAAATATLMATTIGADHGVALKVASHWPTGAPTGPEPAQAHAASMTTSTPAAASATPMTNRNSRLNTRISW